MSNREVIDKFLQGLQVGDTEMLLACLDDGLVFDIRLPENHPHHHLRTGNSKAEFEAYLNAALVDAEFNTFEVRDILESDTRVAVIGFEDYVLKPLGAGAAVDFVWVFELRNQKVVSFFEVFDTEFAAKSYDA